MAVNKDGISGTVDSLAPLTIGAPAWTVYILNDLMMLVTQSSVQLKHAAMVTTRVCVMVPASTRCALVLMRLVLVNVGMV